METALDISILEKLPAADAARAEALCSEALRGLGKKIVVLDDDPTGVQTVHDISVYTDWSAETFRAGFAEQNSMFFILTNSRAFTAAQTQAAHREMARNLAAASAESGRDFVLISRSDSTLRGHFPLETQTLREELEALTGRAFDGEVIFPFFKEGGRYTLDNVHYVKEGDRLIPAGQTEFARDKTFGYTASHLGEWCEEKTGGSFRAGDMTYISLESLRACGVDGIAAALEKVRGFGKIICNAADYADVKVFAAALAKALGSGRRFMIRGAAAIAKVLGGVADRPLLRKEELIGAGNRNGGMVVVGSHVGKTTRQLEALRNMGGRIAFIEFDQHRVLEENGLARETQRVCAQASRLIENGETAVVYTRRDRFDLPGGDSEKQLEIAVRISDAVTGCVAGLEVRPGFLIAKGGITSSEIGTKALRVKKARVMGQIAPGIPVWMTGPESKFPDMPYVIFPGNVGEDTTLRDIVADLMR